MEPEQKENMVLSYITYSFLGIFMLVVAVIIFNETRQNKKVVKYEQGFHIPEVTLLSPEEVEAERRLLFSDSSNNVFYFDIDEDIHNSNTRVTEEDIDLIRDKQKDGDGEVKVVFINSEENVTQTPFEEPKSVRVYSPTNSHMETIPRDSHPIIPKTFVGRIYKIETSNQRIIITQDNNTGFAIINYNNDTNILINQKNMRVSELKVGDNITAEGLGYNDGSSEVIANVIILKNSLTIF